MNRENPTAAKRLNAEFGIENQLCFQDSENGRPMVRIENEKASASIMLHGGHISHFQPAGEKPVLWVSRQAKFQRNSALRGGIPVCWPRFADSAEGAALAFHGFVRTAEWGVHATEALPDGRTQVVLELCDSEPTRRVWPHAFELRLMATVGAKLEIALSTRNTGSTEFVFTEALHSYFNVSDIRTVSVTGLEGCDFDAEPAGTPRARQAGPIAFDRYTDRLYLDTEADCVIDDPGFGRRIRVSKTGSRTTVVWNPWSEKARGMQGFGDDEYLGMVCVESVNAATAAITLKPGEQHLLGSTLSVE